MCVFSVWGPKYEMVKWNESGFRPPLCTYRLNWARRTSWGWWDDWDDTVLQTQDSKFEPWRSETEHATSRSRRLPTILTFTRGWGRNNFCFFQTAETGNRTPDSGVKGSGANHYPRAPAHMRWYMRKDWAMVWTSGSIMSQYCHSLQVWISYISPRGEGYSHTCEYWGYATRQCAFFELPELAQDAVLSFQL